MFILLCQNLLDTFLHFVYLICLLWLKKSLSVLLASLLPFTYSSFFTHLSLLPPVLLDSGSKIIPLQQIRISVTLLKSWRNNQGSSNNRQFYLISSESGSVSHSFVSNSLWPRLLWPARLLWSWNSPGKNTSVGFHFLLQGIFITQGLNLSLLHCREILYGLSHQGSLNFW